MKARGDDRGAHLKMGIARDMAISQQLCKMIAPVALLEVASAHENR
jgi:hypothetical protein